MSIVFPENRKEVSDRMSTDVQNELPTLSPQLRNSILNAMIIGISGRDFDIYKQLQQLLDDIFPVTAVDLDFIRRWGLFKGIDVNPPTRAAGFITATGVLGSVIPNGELFNNEAGNVYEAINQNYTISDNSISVSSLTRGGNTATALFAVDHGLASGTLTTISGADQSDYNGSFIINVTSTSSFNYTVENSPTTPATGPIVSATQSASVEIQSINSGNDQNLGNGSKVTLGNPLAGVDDDAFVQFNNISGGTDEETTEDYKNRVLDAYANPISNFSAADIIRVSKTVPGVARIEVEEAFPKAGEVCV